MPDRIFALANLLVLPCWLLLLLAPRWRTTQVLASFVAPLLLAGLYLFMLITAPHAAGEGFRTLAEVRALFSVDQALTAGWIHYLAFDLFVGGWITRDARHLRIRHWFVAPCLMLTFVFGPAGLAAYLLLKAATRRQFGADLVYARTT